MLEIKVKMKKKKYLELILAAFDCGTLSRSPPGRILTKAFLRGQILF